MTRSGEGELRHVQHDAAPAEQDRAAAQGRVLLKRGAEVLARRARGGGEGTAPEAGGRQGGGEVCV